LYAIFLAFHCNSTKTVNNMNRSLNFEYLIIHLIPTQSTSQQYCLLIGRSPRLSGSCGGSIERQPRLFRPRATRGQAVAVVKVRNVGRVEHFVKLAHHNQVRVSVTHETLPEMFVRRVGTYFDRLQHGTLAAQCPVGLLRKGGHVAHHHGVVGNAQSGTLFEKICDKFVLNTSIISLTFFQLTFPLVSKSKKGRPAKDFLVETFNVKTPSSSVTLAISGESKKYESETDFQMNRKRKLPL